MFLFTTGPGWSAWRIALAVAPAGGGGGAGGREARETKRPFAASGAMRRTSPRSFLQLDHQDRLRRRGDHPRGPPARHEPVHVGADAHVTVGVQVDDRESERAAIVDVGIDLRARPIAGDEEARVAA